MKRIERHAEAAAREQLITILVVLERTRLAHKPVDFRYQGGVLQFREAKLNSAASNIDCDL
jgi:deoxyinosine 3'endonuclease (endonuclease V)